MRLPASSSPHNEPLASGAGGRSPAPGRIHRRRRLGGPEGNEILTSAIGVVLTGLLVAEGVTVVHTAGLVTAHMFIGMVLIPPVLLKLGSTGYRFVRYYTGSHAYRAKGPPQLPLRVMAPALVVTTLAMFTTGVLLLAAGHTAGPLLEIHKVSFIVWLAVFVIHFLAYLPQVVHSLRTDWGSARRLAVPGASLRALLVSASVGGGLALALALISSMNGWRA